MKNVLRSNHTNQKGQALLITIIIAFIGFAAVTLTLMKVGDFTRIVGQSESAANLSEADKFNFWMLQKKFKTTVDSTGKVVKPDWYPEPYPIPSEMSQATTFKPLIIGTSASASQVYAANFLVRGRKNASTGECAVLSAPICKKAPLAADDCNSLEFQVDPVGLGSLQKTADMALTEGIQSGCLGIPSLGQLTTDQKNSIYSPNFVFPLSTAIESVPVTFKKYIADNPSKPNTLTKLVVRVGETEGVIPIEPPPEPTACSLALTSPSEPMDLISGDKTVNFRLSVNGIVESVSFTASGSNNPEFQSAEFNRQSVLNYGNMTPLKDSGFDIRLSSISSEALNPANPSESLRTVKATVNGHSGPPVSCDYQLRVKRPNTAPSNSGCGSGMLAIQSSIAEKVKVGDDVVYIFKKSDPNAVVTCPGRARVLLVGGGGAGGNAGGGGAGGYVERFNIGVGSTGAAPVQVGDGGQFIVTGLNVAHTTNGGDSKFLQWKALGGGGAGQHCGPFIPGCSQLGRNGKSGGSGGGASYNLNDSVSGGLGTLGQGNNGSNSTGSGINSRGAGGGGGAGGAAQGMNGGIGKASDITGASLFYAGGAAAGCGGEGRLGPGIPGKGGGGKGSVNSCGSPTYSGQTAGEVNTGGGGGSYSSGGSGIVIIRAIAKFNLDCFSKEAVQDPSATFNWSAKTRAGGDVQWWINNLPYPQVHIDSNGAMGYNDENAIFQCRLRGYSSGRKTKIGSYLTPVNNKIYNWDQSTKSYKTLNGAVLNQTLIGYTCTGLLVDECIDDKRWLIGPY